MAYTVRARIPLKRVGNHYENTGTFYTWPIMVAVETGRDGLPVVVIFDDADYEPMPIVDGFGPVYGPEPVRRVVKKRP